MGQLIEQLVKERDRKLRQLCSLARIWQAQKLVQKLVAIALVVSGGMQPPSKRRMKSSKSLPTKQRCQTLSSGGLTGFLQNVIKLRFVLATGAPSCRRLGGGIRVNTDRYASELTPTSVGPLAGGMRRKLLRLAYYWDESLGVRQPCCRFLAYSPASMSLFREPR